jgi:hypothetical protein
MHFCCNALEIWTDAFSEQSVGAAVSDASRASFSQVCNRALDDRGVLTMTLTQLLDKCEIAAIPFALTLLFETEGIPRK